jgi:hypothetical protein
MPAQWPDIRTHADPQSLKKGCLQRDVLSFAIIKRHMVITL